MRQTRRWIPAALGFGLLTGVAAGVGCGAEPAAVAQADEAARGGGDGDGPGVLAARLNGYREVPSISTAGNGTFLARRAADGATWEWTLTYADLEGGTGGAVTAAHIHLGQRGVAGGVAIHLCGGGGGTAACPASPATLTGTFTAASVVGPAGQGIAAGELEELLRAAKAGVTYVNVHNATYPTGEIRGQLHAGNGRDGPHDGGGDDDDDLR